MRRVFDELQLRIDYMIESIKLRYYMDRDDPLTNYRRRWTLLGGGVAVALIIVGLVLTGQHANYTQSPTPDASLQSHAPISSAPSPEEASSSVSPAPTATSIAPASPSSPAPAIPPAAPSSPSVSSSSCSPDYSPCVPNVSYDLDCPDIGFKVQVIGVDHYRLDRDGDGIGCDSY